MTYNSKQIADAVSTVHMNSKRQAKRNQTTNYTNGDINFIGDCCFAYSGAIAHGSAQGEKTYLEFDTGPNFVKGDFQAFYGDLSGDWWKLDIYFNDIKMLQWATNHNARGMNEDMEFIKMIIPPFTRVKATLTVGTATVDYMTVNMLGKVYSGAEIIQGSV